MKQEIVLDFAELGSISLTVEDGYGRLESRLNRETCPYCNLDDCNYNCDESQYAEDDAQESDIQSRLQHNAMLDALESLILAHAVAGINVEDPRYKQGIETFFDAISNNCL
jgi:hypothetical protein